MGISDGSSGMMQLEEAADALPTHVAAGPDASTLAAIRRPAITMSVWKRRLGQELTGATRAVLSNEFQLLRLTLEPGDVEPMVFDTLAAAVMGSAAAAIAADVANLAYRFSDVMEQERLDIRLERITGNACKKFHADYVTARLITSYEGRATEWLDQDSAVRLANGVCPSDLPIRRLQAGDVALLKGRLWADDQAIVHRSPPIAGTGEERLLLVINPGELVPEVLP